MDVSGGTFLLVSFVPRTIAPFCCRTHLAGRPSWFGIEKRSLAARTENRDLSSQPE